MCAWVAASTERIERFCGQSSDASAEVFARCPATCSQLESWPNAYPCSDLPDTYTFQALYIDRLHTCSWVAKSEKRKYRYCTSEQQLTACAMTCGVCDLAATSRPSLSISPSTSSAPSYRPSRPPSPQPSPFPTLRPTSAPSISIKPSSEPSCSKTKTIILRNNKTVQLTATTDPSTLTASINVEQTGIIDISTTGIYFTPFSNTEITANLVDFPVLNGFISNISSDAALTIGEFITQQLSAAADFSMREEEESGNELRKRHLDRPGCDLFPDTSCTLGCCAVHDRCFDENNCNAGSWVRTICTRPSGAIGSVFLGPIGIITCGISIIATPQEYVDCNNAAASCIARGCTGISDTPPESCYDNKCDTFYNCPGECKFFTLDDSKCCGCKIPGDTCNATDTCGNGKCDEGESRVNCFVDCVDEPILPSSSPSTSPSDHPSPTGPSTLPSKEPSRSPSSIPTDQPSQIPSKEPSRSPSGNPTSSIKPSPVPSTAPIAPTPSPTKTQTIPTPYPTVCADTDGFTWQRPTSDGGIVIESCDFICQNPNMEIVNTRQSKWCTDENPDFPELASAIKENCCYSCNAGVECS